MARPQRLRRLQADHLDRAEAAGDRRSGPPAGPAVAAAHFRLPEAERAVLRPARRPLALCRPHPADRRPRPCRPLDRPGRVPRLLERPAAPPLHHRAGRPSSAGWPSRRPPHPDGRYRVNELFCGNDGWRPAVTRLMAESDLVAMDLRGFSVGNQGCLFELQSLLDIVPVARIVLLTDGVLDSPFLARRSPSAGREWMPPRPTAGRPARSPCGHRPPRCRRGHDAAGDRRRRPRPDKAPLISAAAAPSGRPRLLFKEQNLVDRAEPSGDVGWIR